MMVLYQHHNQPNPHYDNKDKSNDTDEHNIDY